MRRLLLAVSGIAVALLVTGDRNPVRVARDADPALQRGLEDTVAALEYRATVNDRGLQAPNRAQALRIYFEPTGIRVLDRTAPGDAPLLRLTLAGVGRGRLAAVAAGDVSAAGARVEIRRPQLSEWYENRPDGLEQGFDVPARPAGDGALVLELAVADSQAALVGDALELRSAAGRSLRYGDLRADDATGRALPARFELASPARLRLVVDDASAQYPIAIDPVLSSTPSTTILALPNHHPGTPLNSGFGLSVASAGDVNGDGYADVIVGAHGYDGGTSDSGAAFVFLGGPNGIPSGTANDPFNPPSQGVLLSSQGFSRFGMSVASAGDVNGDGYSDVIVGAPFYDLGETEEGAAFIFLGGASGIASGGPGTAATTLEGNQSYVFGDAFGGRFGWSVAPAGDVNGDGYGDVLVGAPGYTTASNNGLVCVFLGKATGVDSGSPATAATQLTLPASLTVTAPLFGKSLGSAGDVNGDGYDDVIVGGGGNVGVSIFLGSATGIASATTDGAATRLTGPSLGSTVAAAGDVNGDGFGDVIVGAINYDPVNLTGAAFIYHGGSGGISNGTDLTAQTTLTSTVANSWFGGQGQDMFVPLGWGTVAGAGDVNGDGYADVLVSAGQYPSSPGGAAFLFLGRATGIPSGTQSTAAGALYKPANPPGYGEFAGSVAGAGDVNGDGYADIVVGWARSYDPVAVRDGAAFVYLGGPGLLASGAAKANGFVDSAQGGGAVGTSVASAGDVNGDGYSDVIVGAPWFDLGETDEGAAFVFHGGASGIGLANVSGANTTLQGDQENANFGQSVASAGDVNGDGYADVIVGAPLYDDAGISDEGAAFVFHGGPAGVASGAPASASASFHGHQAGSRFGWSVASAGDVNADGRADVIIGAPFYATNYPFEGAAFVFHGGPGGLAGGLATSANAKLRSDDQGAALGLSVASAGDVNGDGFSDVIVGAPLFDGSELEGGLAAIFRGGPGGLVGALPFQALVQITGNESAALFAFSVAGAGDLNGDGFGDVIVGAPLSSGQGMAYVFAGAASPLLLRDAFSADMQIFGVPGDLVGASVAGAGDLNGDGFADLIVGGSVPSTFPNPPTYSPARVVYGQANLPVGSNAFSIDPDQAVSRFGMSVAGAGDVNGDGLADAIIGAPMYSPSPPGPSQPGRAYLFYGGGEAGLTLLPQQLRGNGSGVPVTALGDAWSTGAFIARLKPAHPAGRGRVRVELQACALQIAFTSPACQQTPSAWLLHTPLSPAPAVSLNATGLPAATPIHWRARVSYADATGPLPASPAHGPWRRASGRGGPADLRTSSSTDVDTDAVPDSIDDCRYRSNPGQLDAGGFGASTPPDGIGDDCQCGNVAGSGAVDAADVLAYRQSLANPGGMPLTPSGQTRCVVVGTGTACDIVQVVAIRRAIHAPPLAPIASPATAQVCAASKP